MRSLVGAVARRRASGGGSLSYLETQAAALAPGYWTQLTGMGNLTYALIRDPADAGNILDYCNKGGYDKIAKVINYQGGAHTGSGGLTDRIRYPLVPNAWAKATPSYSSTLSHNWDASCTDPTRGDFYAHSKTSTTFRRLPSGSSTWETIASPGFGSNPESVSLFWDVGRDSLMSWDRDNGLWSWAYSAGSGSWVSRGDPGTGDPGLGRCGGYLDATGELFLGNGVNNPTQFWLYQTNNTFSASQTAPVSVYRSESGSGILIPASSAGRHLVVNKATGAMRSYNPITRSWRTFTPSNGIMPLNTNLANSDAFAVDMLDLECTLFFTGNNNFDAPSCYLYKHTSAPIVPSTITLSGTHDMTQYVEDYNVATMMLHIIGTLPVGVTFNGTQLVGTGPVTGISLGVVPQ